jgi:hypothetical protein
MLAGAKKLSSGCGMCRFQLSVWRYPRHGRAYLACAAEAASAAQAGQAWP